MPTKGPAALDAEIDALFQLPLSEFTSARNSLAAGLRKAARASDADRVKTLPKPPAPAWAVNQLYWQNPEAIDQLVEVTESIRTAQTGRVRNANLRELLDDKKRRLAKLVAQAAAILSAAGHGGSPDAMRRVSATLESLAVWGKTEGGPKAGRLTADLDPPGFDALAALMDGAKIDTSKVLLFRTPKPAEDPAAARARAREAVHAAEKVLREAHGEARRAQTALTKANARTAAVETQKQEIEALYAETKEEARAASNEAKKAAQAVTDAERSLARAKAAME
ncbi:MAG TPA: hypothetical protein VGQ76_19060 [Thermoanaerobaculia bacterium]|jgi:hypothetical protein|nr:hypothetical protein [Thermoanaerobaculia bacterium]